MGLRKLAGRILPALVLTTILAWAVLSCAGENKDMNGVDNMNTPARTVPPIDAAAPVITETATFALG